MLLHFYLEQARHRCHSKCMRVKGQRELILPFHCVGSGDPTHAGLAASTFFISVVQIWAFLRQGNPLTQACLDGIRFQLSQTYS